MTSRHSSASSCCESGVEPTRSQKRTVRWRRSPAVAGRVPHLPVQVERRVRRAADSPRDAPHLPQKSEVGGFSAWHFAQCFASAFPHFAQKLFVEGLFVPHFEQRIDLPFFRESAASSLITGVCQGLAGRAECAGLDQAEQCELVCINSRRSKNDLRFASSRRYRALSTCSPLLRVVRQMATQIFRNPSVTT